MNNTVCVTAILPAGDSGAVLVNLQGCADQGDTVETVKPVEVVYRQLM